MHMKQTNKQTTIQDSSYTNLSLISFSIWTLNHIHPKHEQKGRREQVEKTW